ncbi:MAG: hypothetical protein PHR35_01495 [Kiritimatiellae bacterium]|nr:hypothetical protein [Kiritimatiellia bacterium]
MNAIDRSGANRGQRRDRSVGALDAKRCIVALAVAWMAGGVVRAESINVPNYSFESPVCPEQGYTTVVENWSEVGVSDAGLLVNGFNSQTLTNASGNQMGYLSTVSHTVTSGFHQVLSAAYTVGRSYALTVGVAKCSAATPVADPESRLTVALYWSDHGTMTALASQQVRWGDLATDALTDYSVSLPTVQLTNDCAGSSIGILIVTETNTGNNAYWDIDNVRLAATTVFTPIVETIDVSNASFELPVLPEGGYTTVVDNWSEIGASDSGIVVNGHLGQTFSNLDGNQMAYLSTVSHTVTSGLYQALSATYRAGRSYAVTVGAAKCTGVTPVADPESRLTVSLCWSHQGTNAIIASRQARWGDLSNNAMTDFTANLQTVQPSDSYAGSAIGILLVSETNTGNNVYWYVDDVRLISTRIPPRGGTLITVL